MSVLPLGQEIGYPLLDESGLQRSWTINSYFRPWFTRNNAIRENSAGSHTVALRLNQLRRRAFESKLFPILRMDHCTACIIH